MASDLFIEHRLTHSAKYSPETLDVASIFLAAEKAARGHRLSVLDCFAGTGEKLMAHPMFGEHDWTGVELQEAWAANAPWVRQGNAKELPFEDGTFDAVCTDPVWPNRNRDRYNRKDRCKPCDATGKVTDAEGEVVECAKCKGAGFRIQKRYTYLFDLQHTVGDPDAQLHPDNAGAMKGKRYWETSALHAAEMARVVRPGGLLVVIMGDSVEKGRSNNAVQGWRGLLDGVGLLEQTVRNARIKHIGNGRNSEKRLDAAVIITRKPG